MTSPPNQPTSPRSATELLRQAQQWLRRIRLAEQEPEIDCPYDGLLSEIDARLAADAEGEPVAWRIEEWAEDIERMWYTPHKSEADSYKDKDWYHIIPLYASPPPAPQPRGEAAPIGYISAFALAQLTRAEKPEPDVSSFLTRYYIYTFKTDIRCIPVYAAPSPAESGDDDAT